MIDVRLPHYKFNHTLNNRQLQLPCSVVTIAYYLFEAPCCAKFMFHSSSPKVHYNIIVSAHNLEKIMFEGFLNAWNYTNSEICKQRLVKGNL